MGDNECCIMTVYSHSVSIHPRLVEVEIMRTKTLKYWNQFQKLEGSSFIACIHFCSSLHKILINIYIVLAQGCMMSIFSTSDVKNI